MEYWLMASKADDQCKRDQMMQELKTKNPSLGFTDTCRQAVYYLAQQA